MRRAIWLGGIVSILWFTVGWTTVWADRIGMVTGSTLGTYYQFGNDIAKVGRQHNLHIEVKASKGSLANIERMNSAENAGLGIVQADVLEYLYYSANWKYRRTVDRVRLVQPLYREEVHLFARRGIEKLSDLEGKRVVLGSSDGGTWVTVHNLLRLAGINIRSITPRSLSPPQAVAAVLAGKEVDAMFFVAGKPVTLFSRVTELLRSPKYAKYAPMVEKVHFVNLDYTDAFKRAGYVESTIEPLRLRLGKGNDKNCGRAGPARCL